MRVLNVLHRVNKNCDSHPDTFSRSAVPFGRYFGTPMPHEIVLVVYIDLPRSAFPLQKQRQQHLPGLLRNGGTLCRVIVVFSNSSRIKSSAHKQKRVRDSQFVPYRAQYSAKNVLIISLIMLRSSLSSNSTNQLVGGLPLSGLVDKPCSPRRCRRPFSPPGYNNAFVSFMFIVQRVQLSPNSST